MTSELSYSLCTALYYILIWLNRKTAFYGQREAWEGLGLAYFGIVNADGILGSEDFHLLEIEFCVSFGGLRAVTSPTYRLMHM